jgi:hypothetical protein
MMWLALAFIWCAIAGLLYAWAEDKFDRTPISPPVLEQEKGGHDSRPE